MKKIIYILLITISTSIAFSSCTEDEIKPASSTNSGGGSGRTGDLLNK